MSFELPGLRTRSAKARGIAALVLGLPFLALGLYLLLDSRAFSRGAVLAEGLVVENLLRIDAEGQGGYVPRFRFLDEAGRAVEGQGSLQSNPPLYRPGQKITLVYRPGRPESARIADFFALYGLGSILALLGFGSSLAGSLLWYRHRGEAVVWERGGRLRGLGAREASAPRPGASQDEAAELGGFPGAERFGRLPSQEKEEP